MPLILAIKNRDTVVVGSDAESATPTPGEFGQLMKLRNRSALLMVGNLEAIRTSIQDTVLPRVNAKLSAVGTATLIHDAMLVEIVPNLSQIKGRIEIIVAGIDPLRHMDQPGLYYMDSAQNFKLNIIQGDAVAAGATAAVTSLVGNQSFADSSAEHLRVLAKECLSATKLRWPTALENHIILGSISPQGSHFTQI